MHMRIMKYVALLLFLFTSSCISPGEYEDNIYKAPCKVVVEVDACGIEDIGHNLGWLNQIIVTSLTDQTTNYVGRIWCRNYNGQDYIVTDMPLGSGGGNYHTFTCTGEAAAISDESFYSSLTERDIVWISYCPEPGVDQ
ncbi:MAG: hypothetical protein WAV93_05755 [Bacteroidales bacterium]